MHLIHKLYGAKFDWPTYHAGPINDLMIATVPRSGSTQFSLSLWGTQMLGAPLEYPNYDVMHVLRQRLGKHLPFLEFWAKIRTLRTSPNGVFSYKMFMNDYIGAKRRGTLGCFAPDKVVYLRRSDLIAQAISYSRAIRSGVWFGGMPNPEPPAYDAEHIRACCRSITSQHDFWRRTFDLTKVEPFEVIYEEWLERPFAVTKKVVEFVNGGSDLSDAMPLPELLIQRNNSSAEWKARFMTESSSTFDDLQSAGAASPLMALLKTRTTKHV